MEEHEEVDRWQFADDVQEAIDSLSEGQNGFGPDPSGVNTGLYRAIDELSDLPESQNGFETREGHHGRLPPARAAVLPSALMRPLRRPHRRRARARGPRGQGSEGRDRRSLAQATFTIENSGE